MTATLTNQSRITPVQMALLVPTDKQILIQEIDNFAEAMNGCYDQMTPKAKACALEMAHALSTIRFNLIR